MLDTLIVNGQIYQKGTFVDVMAIVGDQAFVVAGECAMFRVGTLHIMAAPDVSAFNIKRKEKIMLRKRRRK